MFSVKCLLVVLLAAFVASVPLSEEGKKPGHCYVYGMNFKEGDEWFPAPIGHCEKIQCSKAEFESHSSLTCAEFQVPPECYKTEIDLSKRYPACCPTSFCPGDPGYKPQQ